MPPSGDTPKLQKQTQSNRVENDSSSNSICRKVGAVLLTSEKTDFKITKVKRDKNRHFIMIKQTPSRRPNTFQYICTESGSTDIIKQLMTELKGEADKNTILVGDLNAPLTDLDRSSEQKNQ